MTIRSLSRMTLVLVISASAMFGGEIEAAPIRAVNFQNNKDLRQQQWAQRRARMNQRLIRSRPNATNASALSAAGLMGIKGASSNLNTAALNVGAASADMSAAASAITLQDVWASLSGNMRYANRLMPDPNTGLLPDTPFVADLWARRTLNQARFDSNHGAIAQLMDWDGLIRSSTLPVVIKPATNNVRPTNPQVVIPEPSSILIGLGLIGFAAWSRRSRIAK